MIDPDYSLERINLKKRAARWRMLSFLLTGIVLGFLLMDGPGGMDTKSVYHGGYIARIRLNGMITNDIDGINTLRDVASNDAIKGVILSIDSGGGSAVGGEEYYSAVMHVAQKKPVVAVLEQIAASSAYMTAIASDHIISHKFSLVGSIGAVMQSFEVSELADKLGVKFINVKSSPLKNTPNPFEKYTPEMAAAQQSLIDNSHEFFAKMVQERRKLSDKELKAVDNGQVYTGIQALNLKLVDAIGDERSAQAWMHKEKGISSNLQVKDFALVKKVSRLDRIIQSYDKTLGLMVNITNMFSQSAVLG